MAFLREDFSYHTGGAARDAVPMAAVSAVVMDSAALRVHMADGTVAGIRAAGWGQRFDGIRDALRAGQLELLEIASMENGERVRRLIALDHLQGLLLTPSRQGGQDRATLFPKGLPPVEFPARDGSVPGCRLVQHFTKDTAIACSIPVVSSPDVPWQVAIRPMELEQVVFNGTALKLAFRGCRESRLCLNPDVGRADAEAATRPGGLQAWRTNRAAAAIWPLAEAIRQARPELIIAQNWRTPDGRAGHLRLVKG